MATNYQPADLFLVSIVMNDSEAETAVFSNHELDFGCRARVRRLENGSVLTRAFATERSIQRLREISGVTVSVVLNASERSRERQNEVGRGDRFQGGRLAPRGLAEKIGARRR